MIEQTIIATLMRIAVMLSGYPELPDDYPPIVVKLISHEELVQTMCEKEIPEQMEACHRATKTTIALTDRVNKIVYLENKVGKGILENNSYYRCIGVHEMVHLLQLHYRHNDNPALTQEEWWRDEREAFQVQTRCGG